MYTFYITHDLYTRTTHETRLDAILRAAGGELAALAEVEGVQQALAYPAGMQVELFHFRGPKAESTGARSKLAARSNGGAPWELALTTTTQNGRNESETMELWVRAFPVAAAGVQRADSYAFSLSPPPSCEARFPSLRRGRPHQCGKPAHVQVREMDHVTGRDPGSPDLAWYCTEHLVAFALWRETRGSGVAAGAKRHTSVFDGDCTGTVSLDRIAHVNREQARNRIEPTSK